VTVLLRDGRVYEKVYYTTERQFELVAAAQLSTAFPEFSVIEFKPIVIGEEGERGRPDLAIVDRAYRSWAVVEVELSRHSLSHHVRPQLETIVRCNYRQEHADYAVSVAPHLDPEQLRNLIVSVPPEFMIVVDCQSVLQKGWLDLERDLGVHLTHLEVYRASNNDSVFVISGYLPEIRPRHVATLRKHEMLNALSCKSLDALPTGGLSGFPAYSGERILQWRVTKTADSAVLLPPGGVTIHPGRKYELLRGENGRFRIEVD
jgi:hypothetical protein